MSKPESITHPLFGELRWDDQSESWFAQVRDSAGEWLDVVIEPGDEERHSVVERAASLFQRALPAEPRIQRAAVRQELLELYNDTWRRNDDPELTANDLIARLKFTFIKLQPGWDNPVTLSYDAGDLFGEHAVDVELDEKLRVTGTDLVG